MAFDDAFASGQDLLRDSLLSQYQPDDGQPDSINPKVLTDRLARKLALRTTQDAEVDFNVAPEKDEKEPDLSAFGTPVEPKETPEPSEEDLSRFGTPVEVKGPAQKPLTIARQAAAAAKGIPHGAIAGVGDALKGAGAVYDNGTPAQDETPQYDAMGNPTGMVNAPTAAVPAKPLQDRTLYKAGKSVDDFAQSVAPMTQQEKESVPGRIGLGVGGLVPLVAAGVAGGAVAAPFGAIAATIGSLAPAAGAMALDTYGSVFEAAKTAGKSDEEANSSAGKSALVAGVLGSLPLGAGKYAKSLIAKMAVSSLAFTTLGEAQEAILQQIAKDYDPKAGYSLEAKRLIAELVLGAGMGGLHHAFERKPAPPPPGAAPGAAPGPTPTGIPPGIGTPPPGAGPNPGAGYGPNGRANPNGWPGGTGSWGQAPGGGAGPNPGAGPRPGPGPGAGNAGSAGTSSGPPPGTGQGKAGGFTFHPGADFTMGQGQRATAEREYQRTVGGDPSGMGDPELFEALKRAKMERLYRTFEGGKDPSGLADHELFNAVNDHLRDTSNTGHTAKPETPEEAAAREATAKDRDERDILKKAGWTDAHVNAMTPEQRAEYIARATGKGPKAAPETPGSTTQEPPTQPSAQNEPGVAEKAAKSASPSASSGSSQNQSSPDEAAGPEVVKNRASNPEAEIYKGRREAPIVATTADDVLQAQPNEPKSPEQAKAENFQHAHVELPQFGLTGKNSISIETGVGQVRKGEDADGTPWSVTMEHGAYGRIKGTKGADGRELDIMVGPHPASPHIFVIDQHDPKTGEFDEHKIYAGYRTPIDALHAYAHAYDDHGENRVGYVTAMGPEEFDAWRKGDTTKALKPIGEKTADSEAHHNLEPASEQNQPAGRGGTAQSGNAATAQTAAGNDRSQENGKKSKKVAGSAEPQNLLQFLASKGGLKPHPELEVMDAHKHVVEMSSFPYKRKLVREGGMDLDTAREAAEEMGYFRGTHDGTSTIADFLDAIDNGVNRKQHLYPEGFEGHQTKHEATAEAERGAHEDEQVQEFLDQLHATGHGEIGPELRARAVHLMAIDGLDADTAIDTALIQLDTEESEQREQIRATIGKDNYDEAHAATAPQDGGDHAHGVEGGAGREETPTAKPGARAPAESEATGADQGNDTGRSGSAGGKSDTGGAAADQAAPRSAESPSETGDAVGPNADTVETLKQQLIKISSGMSRPRDLKVGGWAVGDNPNRGVGVDVGELSTPALDQVARTVIDHKAKLFVDSGAFSVFRRNIRDQAAADKEAMSLFGKAKPAQWKSLDFDAIMAKYDLLLERIAEHNKAEETDYFRPMLVMPDIVGDQAASLALVKRYKGAISTDTEFNISQPVVPIQRGALSLADAYAQIVKTLGTDKFIVGIPSNEKAVPLAELKAFLAAAQPKRIHFLGAIAEKNLDPKLQVIADLGLKLDHLSADANILRSKLYGRQNYKTRAEGIADILGDEAAQPEPEATPAQIGEFIQHIESEIAAGRTDADISPTRSLKDFQAAAEARGWTYGAYGKGKALWSPDRSHVIFASVSVEGNHVTAQWAKPSEGITPPGGKDHDRRGQPIVETGAVFKTASGRETAPAPRIDANTDRKTKKALFNLDSWLIDEARKEVAGNDYQTVLLKGMNPKNMSQSDRDSVNYLLFGDQDGPRPSDLVRVEGKKPAKPKVEPQAKGGWDSYTDAQRAAFLKAADLDLAPGILFDDIPAAAQKKLSDEFLTQPFWSYPIEVQDTFPAPVAATKAETSGGFKVGDTVTATAVGGHTFTGTITRFVKDYPAGKPSAEIKSVTQQPDKNGKLKEYRSLSIHQLEKLNPPPAPTAEKALGPFEVTSPDQIDHAKPLVLGKVYRGTEAGNQDARLRVTMNGDLGRGVYITQHEKLAASYGGGPKARVSDGTRVVHSFDITKPIAPKDYAYAFASSTGGTVKIVRGNGETIFDGKWTAGKVKDDDSPMGVAIRESGVKVVVGATGGFLHNQTVVLDKSILEPTTETGADNKQQTVLPGAEKIGQGEQAQRKADEKLKPKVNQKPADVGLFGDEKDQTDLLDMVAKKPAAPKDAFDDIFDSAIDAEFGAKPKMNIDDVAKGLGALFGKSLKESEPPFLDEAKYKAALPFFKAGLEHFAAGAADLTTMVRALVRHLSVAGMDADAIRAMKPYIKRFTDDVTAGRETINAPSRSDVLESGGGKPAPENGLGKADVSAAAAATGPGTGERGSEADATDQRSATGGGVSQDHAPIVGERGNLELPAREPDVEDRNASDRERERSDERGKEGFSFDNGTTDEAVRNAQKDADLNGRRGRQQEADRRHIPFKWGRIDNIADSLPMLFPEQHQDVQTAELRFNKTEGHGMLFTNGTGTGKTYSGLGVIKRFFQQGKGNVLVVAPSQGILTDWVKSAKDLGLEMHVLGDTQDKGRGLSATTYANLGANRTLADREWDLVVTDEAHKLSSDQDGTKTAALATLRALTKHPDGLRDRFRMLHRDAWDRIEKMPDGPQKTKLFVDFEASADKSVAQWRDEARPKTLMMSATPFAYHFSLDYAEGYLFDFDRSDDTKGGYNRGDGRDKFYMQHLGYRMRTNKLTKPDADVRSEVMERQLHEYLKKTGSLSGRALTVDKDYDRKFVLAHNAIGTQIDQALNFLQEAENGKYRPIYDLVSKKFDYLTRMRLLEAIKADASIDFINQSLALGRKVVVFHDYNEGGGINPFELTLDPSQETSVYQGGKQVMVKPAELYNEFRAQNPYVGDLKFSDYPPPISTLTRAFPKAMVYNGTVSNKARNETKRLFNDDNSGRDIIIVQSAAGEAGISLHDTTGKKQRVLLNLGMPVRPTTSIQQEGRIYRVGQASDAIFRYMNTGTDWERWTFAGKIADRAGTAENLALGDQARTIRQSYVDAFDNAGDYAPEPGEGKGGKEADRATSHSVSEFDKAKTHYFANSKTSGKRDQREGTDYFATPEPIGLKMVEFADIKPGEKILEPSAGHGAISRYFPEDSARTLVEPSSSLASRAALTSPGARVVVDRFENLDKGANKFDAIVMNPPFGSGGSTAVEHLAKAAGHLKNGGRIVALIPRGPAADAKLEKFTVSEAAKGLYLVGDIELPSVTFTRAGTGARTHIVVFEKQTDPDVAQKLSYQKNRDYSDEETISALFDRIEHTDMGQRLEPKTKDADIPTTGKVTVGGVGFSLESSSDRMRHSAILTSFVGSRFREITRAAEDAGGEYVKSAKAYRFKSVEDRQKFLDAVANPEAAPEREAPSAPSGVTFKTGETIHAKTGGKLFVATANERLDRDAYGQMSAVAKTHGGYYSSFKGNGAIPGFQFKSKEDRQFFLDAMKRGAGFAESESPFAGLSKPPSSPMQRANPASRQLGAEGQAWTLDNGRATGVEHLIAYDAQGKEVDRAIGAVDSVDISPELEAAMMDPRQQIVVHHNHPSNNTLSRDDIVTLAMPGLKAVYAHGHAGNVFRAELTPQFKALGLTPDTMARLLDQLHQAVEQVVKAKVVEAVESFRISGDQANTAYWHLVNQTLHDGGIIDYQTNFELGDLVSHIPGLADMMDRAVAIMKKDVAAKIGAKGERAVRDQNDRRAGAVRHPGDLGTVFDRASLAKPVVSTKVGDRQRAENNSGEAGEGKQLKLSSPDDLFKPPAPGSFDKSINDILRKRLLGRLGDLNATEYRTQLQDKFIRVKKAEESVSAPSDQSAYQAESLYYGRTGQRLESLTDHHIDPLIREMKARDIDVNSFDEFLSARHAPERNNKIGAMYPKGHEFNDAMADHSKVGGSGWSTEEALKVIRAIKAKGKLADYLAVAKMVDALNYKTRRTLLDAGLIDRDTFDQWNAAYKYYVPLRGIADGFEHEESLSRQGSGMNIRGKEAQTAFGRKSKSASPLAYSIMQAEMAVVRAEKNKVGNTFLKFVRANPDPDRWTVNRRDAIRRIDKDTGLVTTMPDNISAQKDNEFATKVDGKNTIITLKGPDGLNLARALKNMGTANVHALIRVYSTLTHTMAKLATSFNPDFMIPNLARDLGEAFINLQAQQQRSFVRKFIGHIPGAMKGSMLALAGKGAGNRYVDAFHRFDKAGGRVRFFGIDDPDQIETNVNRKLKRLQGGALNTIKDFGDSAGKALEVAGGGIENATRLAAFMAAEEVGMSTPDSAMLGRNLTVDFNKKGELGGAISGLYMFANAGIQGQARMARALGHRRVWKAVGALAAAAALSTLYSILNSDTDEAGVTDYMKVPPWERDKNLVFMIGDHNYLKIPLPYGFAPFAVIGSHAVSVLMGHEKPGKAASAIIDSIISAFNPLGDESSLLMDIIPSAIRPAFHITFNKNWTDKPLYPEGDKNRGLRPDSTQSFRNDSAFSKEVAKQLNSWSGGNAYHPGAIDVHPGTIDHVLQALGGGLGRFLKSIADTAYNTINGEEWHPDKTPILRRFVGKVGEEADRALYYEKRQEALDDKAGINQARKDLKTPDREGAKEFLEGNGSAAGRRVEIFKSADAKMKGLRQREDQINNSDQSTEVKRDELTAIRNKMRAVQNEARARVQKLQAN